MKNIITKERLIEEAKTRKNGLILGLVAGIISSVGHVIIRVCFK